MKDRAIVTVINEKFDRQFVKELNPEVGSLFYYDKETGKWIVEEREMIEVKSNE